METPEGKVNDLVINATATIGEKISFRRVAVVEKADDETFGKYMHMGGTISSLVVTKGGDETVAKNLAMQVASMNPIYATEADIPETAFNHEKELQMQMMKEDPKMANKPEKVLQNILKGKVKKHFKDQCLADQEFFLDSKKSVSQYLKEEKAEVVSFVRVRLFPEEWKRKYSLHSFQIRPHGRSQGSMYDFASRHRNDFHKSSFPISPLLLRFPLDIT